MIVCIFAAGASCRRQTTDVTRLTTGFAQHLLCALATVIAVRGVIDATADGLLSATSSKAGWKIKSVRRQRCSSAWSEGNTDRRRRLHAVGWHWAAVKRRFGAKAVRLESATQQRQAIWLWLAFP